MEGTTKNTQFDNLVNYETNFSSNSSRQSIAFQSSADPNALASLMKNSQLINYSFMITQEKTIDPLTAENTDRL